MSGAEVLARIVVDTWSARPEREREEVRAWLRANGVDPNVVALSRDVEVVLLDAPAIVREEFVRDEHGVLRDPFDPSEPWRREVHSLCRVPLPEHLSAQIVGGE